MQQQAREVMIEIAVLRENLSHEGATSPDEGTIDAQLCWDHTILELERCWRVLNTHTVLHEASGLEESL